MGFQGFQKGEALSTRNANEFFFATMMFDMIFIIVIIFEGFVTLSATKGATLYVLCPTSSTYEFLVTNRTDMSYIFDTVQFFMLF